MKINKSVIVPMFLLVVATTMLSACGSNLGNGTGNTSVKTSDKAQSSDLAGKWKAEISGMTSEYDFTDKKLTVITSITMSGKSITTTVVADYTQIKSGDEYSITISKPVGDVAGDGIDAKTKASIISAAEKTTGGQTTKFKISKDRQTLTQILGSNTLDYKKI